MRRTFTLLRTLGRGAHGSVHLAEMHDEDDGYVQTLAVKRLLPEWTDDRDLVARLRAEFKLLALLSHEHIVRVHGLTQLDGGLAILMEPVEGVDLGRIVARAGALEPRVVLEIVSAVADALDAAWCTVPPGKDAPLTVVHRDIKPSNVMLTPRGGVKVMDFGVARATFDTRDVETRSQQFGTARYMAPERWLDGRADHKSDVFSLGVTLVEIATGEAVPRFRLSREAFAEDSREALARIGWEPMRALAERLIAFEPEDRPTAAEVAAAALALLPEAPGAPLRVWANGNVVVQPGDADATTATMTVVREDTVSPSQRSLTSNPPAPPEVRRRWPILAAALPVAVSLLLLGSWLAAPGPQAEPTVVAVPRPAPPPPPPPAPAPALAPVPTAAAVADPPVVGVAEVQPAAPPPRPRPEPVPPVEVAEPALATVQFAVAKGLTVRAGDQVVSGRAALQLPANQSVKLRIDEGGREWACIIDVPPSYLEVAVHPEEEQGCRQE